MVYCLSIYIRCESCVFALAAARPRCVPEAPLCVFPSPLDRSGELKPTVCVLWRSENLYVVAVSPSYLVCFCLVRSFVVSNHHPQAHPVLPLLVLSLGLYYNIPSMWTRSNERDKPKLKPNRVLKPFGNSPWCILPHKGYLTWVGLGAVDFFLLGCGDGSEWVYFLGVITQFS